MHTLHIKISTEVGTQNLVNMIINQVTKGVLGHNHKDRTENTVIFAGILETLEVPIG